MNLTKLFDAQKKLREHINYNGEDRFEKLILALLVEIGECANEWRGFKFWSQDRKPRTTTKCGYCGGKGEGYFSGNEYTGLKEKCIRCDGTGVNDTENPLLEEYVDCLHFILELGIEKKFDVTCDFSTLNDLNIGLATEVDTTWQFIRVHQAVNEFWMNGEIDDYEDIWLVFVGLSEHLRFTWEEVEKAYFSKNQINHERQNNGY